MQHVAVRAAELGIDREYYDALGTLRRVPKEVLARLVKALDRSDSPPSASSSSLIWRRGRTERLQPEVPFSAFQWFLYEGATEVASGADQDGALKIPDEVAPGVYTLAFSDGALRTDTRLIVAPERAYQLDDADADRVWLLAVQLYGVRSRRNWGHGDFTDLRRLVELAAQVGAAGIGLNPLHALFDDRPEQASPYSPNSRLFLNPLYIDAESIPEFPGAAAFGLRDELERLRAADQVDYAAVAAAKEKALRIAHEYFHTRPSPEREADFELFRRERGPSLQRFAAFEVLRRRHAGVWWEWPEEWREPSVQTLRRLRDEAGAEIEYYEFVQWIADGQLAACQERARQLALPVGLYIDLAVGVEPGGADAWSAQESIIPQVEVGAPPDPLATSGQAWGVAAFNPRTLAAEAGAPFGELLGSAMRHAGAIRLDHVLGLNRLYLIPFGHKPLDGTYVRYPLQALLAVAAIESRRHRCLVIGEDLGTVPDELRGVLADWGIWSYLVMMFERGPNGAFRQPAEYRRDALATFATHDLATFAGWRNGHDLGVKRSIGLDPGETEGERGHAHWVLGEALAAADICRDRPWDFLDVVRFIARAPSRLMAVAIEDVLGLLDQPNVPGTINEHPNWRRRLPVTIETLGQHEGLRKLSAVLAEEGRKTKGL
jgi:4-alpha-glucanotransferase